jgi:hypothetical protein
MNVSHRRRLVFHGAIVLLAGVLCGIPESTAIGSGAPEARIHAWRVAHDALVAAGIMLIAVGAALELVADGRLTGWIAGSLVAAGYGAILGLGTAAVAGVRGLEPTGPPLNFVAFLGNLVVAGGTLVGLPLLIWGTRGGTPR